MDTTEKYFILNLIFIFICAVVLFSNFLFENMSFYIFAFSLISYLLLLVACKIKNILYYLFVIACLFLSYIITKVDIGLASMILIGICFLILLTNAILKVRGIDAEVVDCGDKFSIVEVKPDILPTIKPGYYIIQEKLKKGTKVRIKSLKSLRNGIVSKYKIV